MGAFWHNFGLRNGCFSCWGFRRDAFPVPRPVAPFSSVDRRPYAMTVLPLPNASSQIVDLHWSMAQWLCGLRWYTSLFVLWCAGLVYPLCVHALLPLITACAQRKQKEFLSVRCLLRVRFGAWGGLQNVQGGSVGGVRPPNLVSVGLPIPVWKPSGSVLS